MPKAGRLTLSWVGKDEALLATPEGGYEWVPRDDPRVTEVRTLRATDTVGELRSEADATRDNLLIVGDSYDAMHSLTRVPEFAKEYRGRVKLVYIDPPFPRILTCWQLVCGRDCDHVDVEARTVAA